MICKLHPDQTFPKKCSSPTCANLVCQECWDSPLKGLCVECVEKEAKKTKKGMLYGLIFGIAMYVYMMFGIFGAGDVITLEQKILIAALSLVINVPMCVFYYHGARKWAQIGHAERGFKDPEGLKYPLYGDWAVTHWFVRGIYYLLFAYVPFFIGPFVGIPAVVKLYKQVKYIEDHGEHINLK